MTDAARPLLHALRNAPETAPLLDRWEASQRAARCIAPACRSLAAGFDPLLPGCCELRDGVLRLTVLSAAQGAKLRQATPRLQAVLSSAGIQVYEIRVRIEAGITGYPEQGTGAPSSVDAAWLHPSPKAAEALSELALTIGPSRLAQAVEHLARTLQRHAKR